MFPLFSFFNSDSYKDYLDNAISFNRKLNEERKMRIPYIDGQTGVALRHYNNQRHSRERMPPRTQGQVLSYPHRQWRKKRYQYLRFFLQPKASRFDADAEMHTISQIENPSINEDSNHSGSRDGVKEVREKSSRWNPFNFTSIGYVGQDLFQKNLWHAVIGFILKFPSSCVDLTGFSSCFSL